ILCDFALLAAFVENEKKVTLETVREVAKDLESYDYWNEPPKGDPGQNKKHIAPTSLEDAGDILLRLIKLEEIIRKYQPELVALTEKVDKLETGFSRAAVSGEAGKIDELAERISRLEQARVSGDRQTADTDN
ncbi:MAG: hypothetical protein OEU95_02090, partial [Nitrospirota bacterium]|nr:hypothetical protein [Nitrospirota bacterium]